jgi:hypothetical protein
VDESAAQGASDHYSLDRVARLCAHSRHLRFQANGNFRAGREFRRGCESCAEQNRETTSR